MPCSDKLSLFLRAKTYELFAFALDLSQKENEVPNGYTETGDIIRLDVAETLRELVPN
jgi:hypothetical protein